MKLTFALICLFSVNSFALSNAQLKRFRDVAVKITNNEQSSGGSGSIVQSDANGSIILTNRHVCGVAVDGGVVVKGDKAYRIVSYKLSPNHDLCLVKIRQNLKVQLVVSQVIPTPPDRSFVSGHPLLLPNIITEGHFSDEMDVQIMTGVRPCTAEEGKEDPMTCMFMGGFPILENYSSQVVSNLIQPGNSGSPVLNAKGELSGVIFAGSGELGFGLIVPHIYVVYFMATESSVKAIIPGTTTNAKKSDSSVTEAKRRCAKATSYPNNKIRDLCRSLKFNDLVVR